MTQRARPTPGFFFVVEESDIVFSPTMRANHTAAQDPEVAGLGLGYGRR